MNKRWMIAGAAAAGLALIALGGSRLPKWTAAAPGAASGACDPASKPANLNFTLKDVNGATFNLASFKGNVILLDFWATWCGPCKVEIPEFVDLHAKYKDRGFTVVGISVDDTLEQLKPFVAQYRMNYPVLLGLGRDDVQEAFGPIWGLPTAYIISRDGKLCKKHMGLKSRDAFEKDILGLL